MQDRIIGPLTMIQFVYAVIGAGACYSIYMALPRPFSIFLAIPVGVFTIAIVFIKINERPFLDFFLAMLQFLSSPKQRIWHHTTTDNLKIVIYKPVSQKHGPDTKDISHEKIAELAKKLDKG